MATERLVHPLHMPALDALHRCMRRDSLTRATFGYKNNVARLEVVFITESAPYVLLIAARGVGSYAFLVPVGHDYTVIPYLGKDYGKLLDVLGVESNPGNRFSVNGFFHDLNSHVPDHTRRAVASPLPEILARRPGIEVEESDKVYFLGWLTHQGTSKRVSGPNLAKTLALLGPSAHSYCSQYNISSRWTDRHDRSVPVTRPWDEHAKTRRQNEGDSDQAVADGGVRRV